MNESLATPGANTSEMKSLNGCFLVERSEKLKRLFSSGKKCFGYVCTGGITKPAEYVRKMGAYSIFSEAT